MLASGFHLTLLLPPGESRSPERDAVAVVASAPVAPNGCCCCCCCCSAASNAGSCARKSDELTSPRAELTIKGQTRMPRALSRAVILPMQAMFQVQLRSRCRVTGGHCRVEELALPTRAIQLSGEVLSTDEAASAELCEAEAAHRTCSLHRLFKATPTIPCVCLELHSLRQD